jgi:hypothetical protein
VILNKRDVGASINALAAKTLLREGVLWRSGKLNKVASGAELGEILEVINLREELDPALGARPNSQA